MMEFGRTKITEVTAREISKKEISGFNEIKSELSLGKENCDNFWDKLFDSELDSDKIRDITEKAADKIEQQKIEGEIKEISKEYIED